MCVESELSAEQNGESVKPSTDVLALIETIKTEGIAFRREEIREDRAKRVREWITIALVGSTLAAVCWQVFEMIKVYGPIRDQAIASQDSATALILSQRAWLGAKRVSLSAEPKIGSSVDVTIEYENTGHEPARDFDFIIQPVVESEADITNGNAADFMRSVVTTCDAMPDSNRGFVVFPGASGKIAPPDYWTTIPKDLIDEGVEKGDSTLSIAGCFTYQTFGTVHHSSFCYWYKKGVTEFGDLRECRGAHNNAD
jgi:hypothetical protein